MLKTFSHLDHGCLLSVEIFLHIDKKKPCQSHNHEADYVDQCKVNSFVMKAAGLAVAGDWDVASVHSNLKGIKWSSNLTALEAAGDRNLMLKHCHNARVDWKKTYLDSRIQSAKALWQKQWAECLADLDLREDVRSANITAKRDIDGEMAHGTVFAKKCKS